MIKQNIARRTENHRTHENKEPSTSEVKRPRFERRGSPPPRPTPHVRSAQIVEALKEAPRPPIARPLHGHFDQIQVRESLQQHKEAKIERPREALGLVEEFAARCEDRAKCMKLRTTEGPWQRALNNAIISYFEDRELPTPLVLADSRGLVELPPIQCFVNDLSCTSLRNASFELCDELSSGIIELDHAGRVLEKITLRWYDYNDPRNSYDVAYGSDDHFIRSFCDGVMGTFKLVLKTLFPVGGHIIVATMNHMQKRA